MNCFSQHTEPHIILLTQLRINCRMIFQLLSLRVRALCTTRHDDISYHTLFRHALFRRDDDGIEFNRIPDAPDVFVALPDAPATVLCDNVDPALEPPLPVPRFALLPPPYDWSITSGWHISYEMCGFKQTCRCALLLPLPPLPPALLLPPPPPPADERAVVVVTLSDRHLLAILGVSNVSVHPPMPQAPYEPPTPWWSAPLLSSPPNEYAAADGDMLGVRPPSIRWICDMSDPRRLDVLNWAPRPLAAYAAPRPQPQNTRHNKSLNAYRKSRENSA